MVHVPNLIECSRPDTSCKRYIPPRIIEDIPEIDDDFRMIEKKTKKKCGCNKNKKYLYMLLVLLIILAFYVS